MKKIDVTKCEYYDDYYKTCSNFSRCSDDKPYCDPINFKCSYYVRNIEKQLQQLKQENEKLKKLKDEILNKKPSEREYCKNCTLPAYSKVLDEIEKICKVNPINTCWTVLNLCDKCKEKEECGLQSPLSKLDTISNIIKQAKKGKNE